MKKHLPERSDEEKLLWWQGFVDGLRAYAWWRDGVQYVGSCGTTLSQAIINARKDYSIPEEPAA